MRDGSHNRLAAAAAAAAALDGVFGDIALDTSPPAELEVIVPFRRLRLCCDDG